MRLIVASVVALGLAVGVWLLWPRTPEVAVPSTDASGTTTTLETVPTTTSTTPSTTSTTGESTLVTTVEEAEEILQDLWFGWFEGIYNQDEDRIRAVVGNPTQIQQAIDQFGEMEFRTQPTRDGILISDADILRADEACVAVWAQVNSTFRNGEIAGVHVFRRVSTEWLLINVWPLRNDLWEADCDVSLP